MRPVLTLTTLFFLSALALSAALPPWAFEQGPEQLRVRVEASHTAAGKKQTQITMLMRVLAVVESESGIQPGDAVLVLYVKDHEQLKKAERAYRKKVRTGWVGPQLTYPPDALEVGEERIAYLRPATGIGQGRIFEPSGYQYSFSRLITDSSAP